MTILTANHAARFMALTLGHLTREFPHKLDHVMDGPEDARTPRELHPIFFGSFDWHSCLHGWWQVLRLARHYPDLPEAVRVHTLADAMLTAENFAVETAYLTRPSARGFERPYGWAWALALHAEMVRHDRPWAYHADAFAAAIQPNTRAIFAESLGNPSLTLLDIHAIAEVAHAHGLPLVVDNTVPSPYLCNPIAWGADIVVHSATKYIAGHGTTLGGVVVESGKFPWDNGKFPGMTEPSPGYHGVKFYETFGDFGFTMRARMETLRVYGAALSPTSAWQILQGLETLPLRMERHCANAHRVARHLKDHPAISWVNYPGLEDHPQHALAQRQLRQVNGMVGASGLLAFGIRGGYDSAVKFIEGAQFMSHLANIGDTRTLIIHPASTTHQQLTEEEQSQSGVTPDLIRVSVGLEHIDDLKADLAILTR